MSLDPCLGVESQLQPYLDRQLTPGEVSMIEQHLVSEDARARVVTERDVREAPGFVGGRRGRVPRRQRFQRHTCIRRREAMGQQGTREQRKQRARVARPRERLRGGLRELGIARIEQLDEHR